MFHPTAAEYTLSLRAHGKESAISFTGLNLRCQLGWFILEALEKNPFPCFFQVMKCIMAPPSIFKASSVVFCLYCHIYFFL